MCSLIKYPEYMYIKKAIFLFKFTLVTIFSSWFYMSKYIYTAHMHVVWIPNTLVMLFILNNRTHQLIFFLGLNERFFSNAVDKLFDAIVLHSLNIVKSNRFNFRTTLTDSKMWEKNSTPYIFGNLHVLIHDQVN